MQTSPPAVILYRQLSGKLGTVTYFGKLAVNWGQSPILTVNWGQSPIFIVTPLYRLITILAPPGASVHFTLAFVHREKSQSPIYPQQPQITTPPLSKSSKKSDLSELSDMSHFPNATPSASPLARLFDFFDVFLHFDFCYLLSLSTPFPPNRPTPIPRRTPTPPARTPQDPLFGAPTPTIARQTVESRVTEFEKRAISNIFLLLAP